MWVADAVLRRAAALVPVDLPKSLAFARAVGDVDLQRARGANLQNLEFLTLQGRGRNLRGGYWRDLMRACELLDCPSRMPDLITEYRAALQRVGSGAD